MITTMKHTLYILLGVVMLTASCSILDKNPDTRTTIDSKKKVQLLLGSGYSEANPNIIAEVTSDNMIDNNAPTADGQVYYLNAYNQVCHQLFAFEDVNSGTTQDSPHYLWQGDYKAIAVANQALEAIDKMIADGEYTAEDLANEKAEALLIRAFHHFRLAQIFCQAYGGEEWNKNNLGLVYMTAPETTVHPVYHRETLAETYAHIEDDIFQALGMYTDDSYMTVPRYHMNVMAAHAFAARFYLYTRQYDKVIEHANYVLSDAHDATLLPKLFDADQACNQTPSSDQEVYVWIDGTAPWNLMVQTSMSSQLLLHQTSYGRYNFNGDARSYSVSGGGPNWSSSFPGIRRWQYKAEYGIFIAKIKYFFEYTNKIAGTGYRHTMLINFTTNETLLCRAEAEAHLGQLDLCLADLNQWCTKYNIKASASPISTLTDAQIRTFYRIPTKNVLANASFAPTLHNTELDPNWVIDNNNLPYVYCCLHFRRIETMHEGRRFEDLKRYAIEWKHTIGEYADVKYMKWDDDRRAIQLPDAVIQEGLEANPRTNVGDHVTPRTMPREARTGDPTEDEIIASELSSTITEALD